MVWVPGGIYRSGARVLSVGAFAMDRTEVTAQTYQGCVTAGVCEPAPDPYGLLRTPNTPVVNVRWMDAMTFCGWVGGRLPTEAEWEFAGRSVDGRRYPWGERLADCSLAALNGCGVAPSAVGTHPAGRSPFGALDLAGNVAEWVFDRFGPLVPGFVRDPTGPDQGLPRVVRGGSFGSAASALELGARVGLDPRERRYNVGFRCVRGG
jgi:formylglycine-generating enzyme required for sulfatase activity